MLAFCFAGLLDDLISCIYTRSCPHYFLPRVNLFEDIKGGDLDKVSESLQKFRKSLDVQSQKVGKRPLLPPGEVSVFSAHGITAKVKSEIPQLRLCGRVGHEFLSPLSHLKEDSLQLKRMSLMYRNGYTEGCMAAIADYMERNLKIATENGGVRDADETEVFSLDEIPKASRLLKSL